MKEGVGTKGLIELVSCCEAQTHRFFGLVELASCCDAHTPHRFFVCVLQDQVMD